MTTKLEKVRAFWAKHDYRAALAIVAKFQDLGADKAQIVRGYECQNSPAFYAALGFTPAAETTAALAAVAKRYGLPEPAAS